MRPVTYKELKSGVSYKHVSALDIALYIKQILEVTPEFTRVEGSIYNYHNKEVYETREFTITADNRSSWHPLN